MRWKDFKISQKISIGYGVILAFLVISGGFSYFSLQDVIKSAEKTAKINYKLEKMENDHVVWVNRVQSLFSNDNITKLDVETDDHKCSFGKWLYGADRKMAEQMVPELVPIFKKIEVPHNRLHASAIKIQEQFVHDKYMQAKSFQKKSLQEWRKISESFNAALESAMEEVIDPAKTEAEKAGEIVEIVKWGEIDMVMNESITQPFLVLRIEAGSLAQAPTDEQWMVYERHLQKVRDGVAEWIDLIKGHENLINIAEKIQAYLNSFETAGMGYHKAMIADRESSGMMHAAKITFQE